MLFAVARLDVLDLTKRFGATLAVDRLDLAVEDCELVTLLGPSGSGKTTVLRMIAGYVSPSSGRIQLGGEDVASLPPEKRDIGMVFQSYALFPHMTVFKNVAFGLERRRFARKDVTARVSDMLDMVKLSGLESRYPNQLSGGQQQRVALARALVIRPRLLLLDEPLSNLDARLRGQLRPQIVSLQRELGITTLLVTHDQEEALGMSDRVAVLMDGRMQQIDEPRTLYQRPANRFVAEFVGKMNVLSGTRISVEGDAAVYRVCGDVEVRTVRGPEKVLLGIRPENLQVGEPPEANRNQARGRIQNRAFLGERLQFEVKLGDGTVLMVRRAGLSELADLTIREGDEATIWWSPSRTVLLPDEE